MAKNAYDPHLKASLYGHNATGAAEQHPKEKGGMPKKKWLQTRKERKGSPGYQAGRVQKTRKSDFKNSGR